MNWRGILEFLKTPSSVAGLAGIASAVGWHVDPEIVGGITAVASLVLLAWPQKVKGDGNATG